MPGRTTDQREFDEEIARLKQLGSDVAQPMPVDFHAVFEEEASADNFADDAEAHGISTTVEFNDDFDDWVCICSLELQLTLAAINTEEERLERLARPHGGTVVGWASFGNARKQG